VILERRKGPVEKMMFFFCGCWWGEGRKGGGEEMGYDELMGVGASREVRYSK